MRPVQKGRKSRNWTENVQYKILRLHVLWYETFFGGVPARYLLLHIMFSLWEVRFSNYEFALALFMIKYHHNVPVCFYANSYFWYSYCYAAQDICTPSRAAWQPTVYVPSYAPSISPRTHNKFELLTALLAYGLSQSVCSKRLSNPRSVFG